MITWTLAICTAAWGLCGQYREVGYQTEQQCYKAKEDLVRLKGADYFKYVLCEPRAPHKPKEGT